MKRTIKASLGRVGMSLDNIRCHSADGEKLFSSLNGSHSFLFSEHEWIFQLAKDITQADVILVIIILAIVELNECG